MSFRRVKRGFSLRPVRSVKEIVDGVFLAVAGGVITVVAVATAVNDYTGAVGTCPIGATIKALYVEASYSNQGTIRARIDWLLGKSPSNLPFGPVPGATGGDPERKWIFHESKGLNPPEVNATPSKKSGWIRVPPKMTRMGEDDALIFRIGSSQNYNFCLKVIYKWYA